MNSEPDPEAELSKLIDKWRQEHQNPNYDPVPFLTNCSKIMESELTEFHKGDPDPFDQRHPKHVLPGCKFGKLLSKFESCNELTDKIVSMYLKTTQSPKNVEPTVVAAARLALAACAGYSVGGLDTEEWMRILLSWIIKADEPLRTYATGLLDGTYAVQKATNEENVHLITTLLKRLWNYIEPNKYDEPECVVRLDKCNNVSTKKRKSLSELTMPSPKMPRVDTPKKAIEDDDFSETICENDLSNSSWAEQMPVILGVSYSMEPPLSESLRQGCIFDLIKCYGEFQDFLSLFLRWRVLELVNKFLKNKSEGQLTFKVLEFLSSLLCHNKLAMNFVESDGIQNLLLVPRPSMGSTGVALCLYNLAYKKEVMEKTCQPTSQILKEIVKYAIWLLECSHESGRSHIASFFSTTLSYKYVLNLFDNLNGLRCLVNVASTARPIAASSDDGYDPLDDDDLPYITSQIIKAVCIALRRYFEAHIIFKVSQAVKSSPTLKQKYLSLENITKYEPSSHTRDEYFEYFDVLRALSEGSNSFNLDCWSPIALFHRLEGIPLMLKIVSMASELDAVISQVEVARAALDVLCVVTLSRPCQLMLTRRYPNLGIEDSGMSVVMAYINDDSEYEEQQLDSVAMNSAIAILANCTGSTYCKGDDDNEAVKSGGTPKPRKKRKVKETLCRLIQQNDGIAMLLRLLETTEPAQTADETRYFACRVLVGLSDYKPVRQILSKLPVFVSGKLFTACKEPVLKDRKHLHKKLCESMEILLKRVTGKAISLDGDLKTAHKTNIVSETRVQFHNKDVLTMIHNHLLWSGLQTAADALAQESGIATDQDDHQFTTPKFKKLPFQRTCVDGSGDNTPKQAKITFSRGDRASADTPTAGSVIKTPFSQRRAVRTDGVTSMSRTNRRRDRFTLSHSGFVTVNPRSNHTRRSPSPVTLNSIIEEYFQHQHSKCQNPVVTVPQFSLFTPHRCPEPRNKIEASINATRRLQIRQGICPKWGGIGGLGSDLRLIYNRFKLAGTIKCNEERKVHFTSVAFHPDGDCRLILGDSAGNVQIPESYSYEDRVVHGISNSAIIHLEPSNIGDVVLTISPTFWSSKCSLLALNDRLDQKLSFDDIDFVEFSKAVQDKILGTRESKAIVFDANTGSILDSYDKEELACNYKSNCATFSYDDKLILSDGLLWDVRRSQVSPIHKFDKFNANVSGVFHPNGTEVIINTEVWDTRNFSLLRTVPSFDQCTLLFNRSHSVIYATKMGYFQDDDSSKLCKGLSSAFQTFESTSYDQLGFNTVKQQIYALALDNWDRNIAIVESPSIDDSAMSVCRLYEVGLARDDNEEEENVDSSYEARSSADEGNESPFHGDDDEFSIGGDSSFESMSEIGSGSSLDSLINSDSDWETTDED